MNTIYVDCLLDKNVDKSWQVDIFFHMDDDIIYGTFMKTCFSLERAILEPSFKPLAGCS